jgi:hypothetical protein
MSNVIMPIDLNALGSVTGGSHGHGSSSYGGGSQILNDLGNLATQLKDVTNKTSGLSSTSMLLLCCLALQRNQGPATNVVYFGRPRYW